MRIGHRLLCTEGFGGNEEKGRFWIYFLERLCYMGPIHVGNEKQGQIRMLVRF